MEDEKPSVLPLATPEEELTQEFSKEKSGFILTIKDALKANGDISQSSHYPLPEMRISPEVPKGTVLIPTPKSVCRAATEYF